MVLGFGMREVSLDPAEHSWDLLAFLAIAVTVVGFWRYCGGTPGKVGLRLRIGDASTRAAASLGGLVVRFLCFFRVRVAVVSRFPVGGGRPAQAGLAR